MYILSDYVSTYMCTYILGERERERQYPQISHFQLEYQRGHINIITKSGLLVAPTNMTIAHPHPYYVHACRFR